MNINRALFVLFSILLLIWGTLHWSHPSTNKLIYAYQAYLENPDKPKLTMPKNYTGLWREYDLKTSGWPLYREQELVEGYVKRSTFYFSSGKIKENSVRKDDIIRKDDVFHSENVSYYESGKFRYKFLMKNHLKTSLTFNPEGQITRILVWGLNPTNDIANIEITYHPIKKKMRVKSLETYEDLYNSSKSTDDIALRGLGKIFLWQTLFPTNIS